MNIDLYDERNLFNFNWQLTTTRVSQKISWFAKGISSTGIQWSWSASTLDWPCLDWFVLQCYCFYSARIVPNEVGVRLHLPRNFVWLGAWMWGSDDVHMERGGSAQEVGSQTPGIPPANRALCFYEIADKGLLIISKLIIWHLTPILEGVVQLKQRKFAIILILSSCDLFC